MINKNCLLIYFLTNNSNFSKTWLVCMLMMQFSFNLSYIVHRRASSHRDFVLKELRKLMDHPRVASEDVCVINTSSLWMCRLSSAKKSWFKNYKTFCKLSVKVVRVTSRVYVISKSVKISLHLVSILAKIFRGFASKLAIGEHTVPQHTP